MPRLITYAMADTFSQMRDEDIRMLDAVNICTVDMKSDGTAYVKDPSLFDRIAHFRTVNPNIKFLLMLASNNCSDVCQRKAWRENFANTLMALLKELDMDGMDNDWEVPTLSAPGRNGRPEDRLTYTMLMQAIRRRMDEEEARTGRHYLLTCALCCDRFVEDTVQIDKLIPLVDYINVMTYDLREVHARCEMHNDNALPAGHHTNTYPSANDPEGVSVERTVEIYRAWGVPDDKIVVGSGLYTKCYRNAPSDNFGLMGWTGGTEEFLDRENCRRSKLVNYYMKNGYERHWDDDAKACWLYSEKDRMFVSYEDEESLWHKVDYIKREGLLGIMLWHYENDDMHTLIPAAYKYMQE